MKALPGNLSRSRYAGLFPTPDSRRYSRSMRLVGGILLWLIATVSGVFGAGWLSLAGVGWDGGFIKRISWDESESGIGVGFAIFSLVVWLGLLGGAFAVMRGGQYPTPRAVRAISTILTAVSLIGVVLLVVLAVGWPEPPSEFPTPPWNRA